MVNTNVQAMELEAAFDLIKHNPSRLLEAYDFLPPELKAVALQTFCQLHLDSEDVDVLDKLGALQENISAHPDGHLLR